MGLLEDTLVRIDELKDAGFTHLKAEFEADLGRSSSDYDEDEEDTEACDYCENGHVDCGDCDGTGILTVNEISVECEDCAGEGIQGCDECDARGWVEVERDPGEYASCNQCHRFMKSKVSERCRELTVFSMFYNDGSVDSEFTVTVPIEHPELLLEWMEAFKALAVEVGNGINVGGAGLHLALLTEGRYPCRISLNRAGYRNFQQEVTKLLPALYFLASAGHQSRELGYRLPRISEEDKYSAIYAKDRTSLEYRIFETCYDRPEALYEYIQVIANTIKYYADPSLKVESIHQEFVFPTSGSSVSRFFEQVESLQVLHKQVKILKPAKKSIKKLKEERGMGKVTVAELRRRTKVQRQAYAEEYKRFKRNFRPRVLAEYERVSVEEMMVAHRWTRERAMQELFGANESVPSFTNFMTAQRGRGYGNWVVQV